LYFDIKKSEKTGEYWFVARAANHGTLCTSELYKSKASAKHAIRVIMDDAASALVYDETGEVAGTVENRLVSV